jgi:hypothetical protein
MLDKNQVRKSFNIIEGSYAKYKVGEHPKFKNKDKDKISKRLVNFIKMHPEATSDIHFDAAGAEFKTFSTNSQTEIKVTDKKTLSKITKYMSIYDIEVNGFNTKVTNGTGIVLFKFSSGRGFYFQSEKPQGTPTTAQQETGTIKFLEYNQQNNKYPTMNQINEMVGFVFDESWYKSFTNHTIAINRVLKLTKKHKIELDSDSSSIGAIIFKILKKNHSFKGLKDNWNPADIWIYDGTKRSSIITKLDSALSIVDFNLIIKKLFEDGYLYGVSLKKAVKPTTAKVIDISDVKPFSLSFAKSEYNITNTYWDIKTSGEPKGFMIRARAKAAAITKISDIKIYFEGKIENSSEFLGAIESSLIKTSGSDTISFEVSVDDIKTISKDLSNIGKMSFKNMDKLDTIEYSKLVYIYVMMRYALNIYKAGKDNLNKLAMSGFKLNDYSSIHYKVGG